MADLQRGLFVGLVTLDFLYLVERMPTSNEKTVALDYTLAAGGPATNAAIAFRHLGPPATVLGAVGSHPLSQIGSSDVRQYEVEVIDLLPHIAHPLPTSSIFVTQATGDRAVVSLNARRTQAQESDIPASVWQQLEQKTIGVVLLDGHQMEVGRAIAQRAHQLGIPTVLDGGSWKPGLESLLPNITYAICSSHFHPPDLASAAPAEVFALLREAGIPYRAITQGSQPILFESGLTHDRHSGSVAVPSIRAQDTCGAGDILHGAFCHWMLQTEFAPALQQAAAIASYSCQFFGTRQWMQAGSVPGEMPLQGV